MPVFEVKTSYCVYPNVVERGVAKRVRDYLPRRLSKLFLLTTEDVWRLHGPAIQAQLDQLPFHVLFFPGGESNKRLAVLEDLAEQMSDAGADRNSLVIGF